MILKRNKYLMIFTKKRYNGVPLTINLIIWSHLIIISKWYPSILINSTEPIPLYTIHNIIEPFTHKHQLDYYGEFYIDEFIIHQFGADIKIEAGFYGRQLVKHLVR